MVSLRCKMFVEGVLRKLGIEFLYVDLGVVETNVAISQSQRKSLNSGLLVSGLILMDDHKYILIEKIKTLVVQMVHNSKEQPKFSYSNYISDSLGYDYTYLANIFSEDKGMTIQHYIILNRIEKVKELLLYGELNLTEISHKLNYCSVAHLSNQFKQVTGLTPSYYRQMRHKHRGCLEDI